MTRLLSPLSYLNLPFDFKPLSSPVDKRAYKELSTEDISPSEFALCTGRWNDSVFERCLRFARHHFLTNPAEQCGDDIYSAWADAAATFARGFLFKDEGLSSLCDYSVKKHPTGLWNSVWFGLNLKNARGTLEYADIDEDRQWYLPSSPEHLYQCDWRVDSSCLCIVYFLTRDALDLAEIDIGAWTHSEACPMVHGLLSQLRAECLKANCNFGLITDGRLTIVYKHDEGKLDPAFVDILFFPVQERSVLFLFALTLFRTGCTSLTTGPNFHYDALLGALNDRSLDLDDGSGAEVTALACSRHSRENFDLYTMQRCPEEYLKFYRWHTYVQAEALRSPLQIGATLKVCVNGFSNRYLLHRSPHPSLEISEESLAIITQNRRPRDSLVDAALSTSSFVEFQVTDIVRAGPRQWSQVFFGRICGSATKLCLKLLDERYFHLPTPPTYTEAEHVAERLLTYNCANDMVRREESVYDRLSDFQGTFIPHCYGFHEFEQPDGWRTFGVLLELIPGPSLEDLPLNAYSTDTKRSAVTELRHVFRALKCRGIHQTDWHANQILCLHPHDEVAAEGRQDFVIIDFAFALQCLGDECGCFDTGEWNKLLGLVMDVFQLPWNEMEERWIPRADYEW